MIESNIMKAENKRSVFWQILEDSKELMQGHLKPESGNWLRLQKNLILARNILSPSTNAPEEIKGNLKELPFYELIKIASAIYNEGSIQIINGNNKANIVIKNKVVVYASINDLILGHKAFLRIASWEEGSFLFRASIQVQYFVDSELSAIPADVLYSKAKGCRKWFETYYKLIPPSSIKIGINKAIAQFDVNFTPKELNVLCTIIEFSPITDIIDSNDLPDIEIYEAIIELRKKNALEVWT